MSVAIDPINLFTLGDLLNDPSASKSKKYTSVSDIKLKFLEKRLKKETNNIKKQPDLNYQAILHFNIAYKYKKKQNKCISHIKTAIKLAEESNNTKVLIACYSLLCNVYAADIPTWEANDPLFLEYKKALETLVALDEHSYSTEALYNLACYYRRFPRDPSLDLSDLDIYVKQFDLYRQFLLKMAGNDKIIADAEHQKLTEYADNVNRLLEKEIYEKIELVNTHNYQVKFAAELLVFKLAILPRKSDPGSQEKQMLSNDDFSNTKLRVELLIQFMQKNLENLKDSKGSKIRRKVRKKDIKEAEIHFYKANIYFQKALADYYKNRVIVESSKPDPYEQLKDRYRLRQRQCYETVIKNAEKLKNQMLLKTLKFEFAELCLEHGELSKAAELYQEYEDSRYKKEVNQKLGEIYHRAYLMVLAENDHIHGRPNQQPELTEAQKTIIAALVGYPSFDYNELASYIKTLEAKAKASFNKANNNQDVNALYSPAFNPGAPQPTTTNPSAPSLSLDELAASSIGGNSTTYMVQALGQHPPVKTAGPSSAPPSYDDTYSYCATSKHVALLTAPHQHQSHNTNETTTVASHYGELELPVFPPTTTVKVQA